jgi:predicted N-acetyltransferase YhbS
MLQTAEIVMGNVPGAPGGFLERESRVVGECARTGEQGDPGALGFGIRAADTEADRRRARELVERMFGWRGYRATHCEARSECALTFIATDGDQVVATIAVRVDGPLGLATDGLYRPELDAMRARGARLCEFTQLAVDRSLRSKELLARLFHAAMIYARGIRGCSDVVIEVNPRHALYYERMFDFVPLGPERIDPRVNAPAVPMGLDLAHSERQVVRSRTAEGRRDLRRTLYPLFFAESEELAMVAHLRQPGVPTLSHILSPRECRFPSASESAARHPRR